MAYSILIASFSALSIFDLVVNKTLITRLGLGLVCLIILTLFAGLRWKTGNDWEAYYNFYASAHSISYQAQSFEIGFRGLVQLCKAINLNYTGFLLIVSFLQMVGFFRLFNQFKFPVVLFLIFVTTYYLGYIGTIRQTIAVSFCLLGFVDFLKNKNLKFLFWVAMGSCFHISAIICIGMIFVPKRQVSKKIYLSLIVGSLLISQYIIPMTLSLLSTFSDNVLIVKKLIDYSTSKAELGEQASLGIIWYIKRFVLVGLFYYIVLWKKSRLLEVCYNMYFCSLIIFVLFFNLIPMLAIRGGEYFTIFEVVLLPQLFLNWKSIQDRILMMYVLVLFSSFRLHNSIQTYHPDLFLPYYSVFEKDAVTRIMH